MLNELPDHFNVADNREFILRLVSYVCSPEYTRLLEECGEVRLRVIETGEDAGMAQALAVSAYLVKQAELNAHEKNIYALQLNLNTVMYSLGKAGINVTNLLLENKLIKQAGSSRKFEPTTKAIALFSGSPLS